MRNFQAVLLIWNLLLDEEAKNTRHQSVDRKTSKVIEKLNGDLPKNRAETTRKEASKQGAMDALRHEKKKRKCGKKLIEQYRAEQGSESILLSPGK